MSITVRTFSSGREQWWAAVDSNRERRSGEYAIANDVTRCYQWRIRNSRDPMASVILVEVEADL